MDVRAGFAHRILYAERVACVDEHVIAAVGAQQHPLCSALSFHLERDRHHRCVLDHDLQLLDRRDQEKPVTLLAKDRREQADHRVTLDHLALVEPGAASGNPDVDGAALGGFPLAHGRQASGALLREQRLEERIGIHCFRRRPDVPAVGARPPR